jgi:hypothetical protein
MFDRPHFSFPTHHHTTTEVTKNIHEHRAPTDQSVALLREMEQAARDKIIASVHINDTSFDGTIHIQKRFEDDVFEFVAIFSLNGQRLTAKHVTRDIDRGDKHKAIRDLRDEIAKVIANTIIQPALERATWPITL